MLGACDGDGSAKPEAKPADASAAQVEGSPSPAEAAGSPEVAGSPEAAGTAEKAPKTFPPCAEVLTAAEVKEACGIDVAFGDLPLKGAETYNCVRKGKIGAEESRHSFDFSARDFEVESTRAAKYKSKESKVDRFHQVGGMKEGVSFSVTEKLLPGFKAGTQFACDQVALEKLATLVESRLP